MTSNSTSQGQSQLQSPPHDHDIDQKPSQTQLSTQLSNNIALLASAIDDSHILDVRGASKRIITNDMEKDNIGINT